MQRRDDGLFAVQAVPAAAVLPDIDLNQWGIMGNPAEVAVAWSMTLVEPLMDPRRRNRAEAEFFELARRNPRWVAAFLAGVLADVAGTLPLYDPWRHLSARIGDLTIGPNPPATMGARRPLGDPFGRREAATAAPFAGRPELDPASAATADDLEPAAAAVIAFAPEHWSVVLDALTELWQVIVGSSFSAGGDPTAIEEWQAALCQALRRLIYQRRTYWGGMDDDAVAVDACFRWSLFASDLMAGHDLDGEMIDGPILEGRELLTDLHHNLSVLPEEASDSED